MDHQPSSPPEPSLHCTMVDWTLRALSAMQLLFTGHLGLTLSRPTCVVAQPLHVPSLPPLQGNGPLPHAPSCPRDAAASLHALPRVASG